MATKVFDEVSHERDLENAEPLTEYFVSLPSSAWERRSRSSASPTRRRRHVSSLITVLGSRASRPAFPSRAWERGKVV